MTLSTRDRSLTLIGILLALFLGALDQTIVSTALPSIVEDLNGLNRYVWGDRLLVVFGRQKPRRVYLQRFAATCPVSRSQLPDPMAIFSS